MGEIDRSMVQTIFITYHPASIERFSQGGRVLTKIGVGRMKSPGHPGGNQQFHTQLPFFRAMAKQHVFPVFWIKNSRTMYMGDYKLSSYGKRQSFEGFSYFCYTMHRVTTGPLVTPGHVIRPGSGITPEYVIGAKEVDSAFYESIASEAEVESIDIESF